MAAQEGLEDADRRSVRLGQFGWLAHQTAFESERLDVASFERFLDARVERFRAAFVAAAPGQTRLAFAASGESARIVSSALPLMMSSRAPRAESSRSSALSDLASRHFAAPPSGRAPPPGDSSWI